MPDHEPLHEIAHRIGGALDLLIEALRDAVVAVAADHADKGYDPADDPAFVSASVRRYVRERMKPTFPALAEQSGNMSPVHLWLGPYQVRLIHAVNGSLPTARTDARRQYYGWNDLGVLALNVFPPDGLVAIEVDEEAIPEHTLVLLWDGKDGELTQATLCRPSLVGWPGDKIDLVTVTVAEDDLDEIARRPAAAADESHLTGTGHDAPPRRTTGDSEDSDDDE